MSDPSDKRLAWLSSVFDSAIKHGVFRPADVITHATPDVIARDLPRELVIRIFEVAFDAAKLTPEGILGVAPPATLTRHMAPGILWEVVRDAAIRHGIAIAGTSVPKTGKTPLRNWLAEVIAAGLEREIFTPADVTRHIPPGEWVKDVPLEVVARMIAAGLTRPQFDPKLALEYLTPQIIGEYLAPSLSWALIDESAGRAFELASAKGGARPSLRTTPVGAAAAGVPVAIAQETTAPIASGPIAVPPPAALLAPLAAPLPPIAAGPMLPAAPVPAPAHLSPFQPEAVESWVESGDMVEAVESTPASGY